MRCRWRSCRPVSCHVVLVEPEIPQNTGNVARTCAATGTPLHLVHPLGFRIDDRSLRRAGVDYWDQLELHEYPSLEAFLTARQTAPMVLFSSAGATPFGSISYAPGTYLVFGRESTGLPGSLVRDRRFRIARIPTLAGARSLNLSNSVAIALYEALRQHRYAGLEESRATDRT